MLIKLWAGLSGSALGSVFVCLRWDIEMKLVQDRKTGQWYDPQEEFEKLQKDPDYIAQMKRMGREEGKGWPKRTEQGETNE